MEPHVCTLKQASTYFFLFNFIFNIEFLSIAWEFYILYPDHTHFPDLPCLCSYYDLPPHLRKIKIKIINDWKNPICIIYLCLIKLTGHCGLTTIYSLRTYEVLIFSFCLFLNFKICFIFNYVCVCTWVQVLLVDSRGRRVSVSFPHMDTPQELCGHFTPELSLHNLVLNFDLCLYIPTFKQWKVIVKHFLARSFSFYLCQPTSL